MRQSRVMSFVERWRTWPSASASAQASRLRSSRCPGSRSPLGRPPRRGEGTVRNSVWVGHSGIKGAPDMPRRKEPKIPDAVLDQLLAGADSKTAFDPNGLLDDLKKALADRALNAEMDHHL